MGVLLTITLFVKCIYLIYTISNIEKMMKKQQADLDEVKSLLKVIIKDKGIM